MNRLLWILRHAGLALPAALAALVLAIAVGVQQGLVLPLEQEAEAARAKALKSRQVVHRDMEQKLARERDPRAQLAEFNKFFQSGETLSDAMARLYNVAEAQGIQLRKGEYRMLDSRGERLARYQITFPVEGNYPNVRRFASAVLNAFPTAALEQVRFERKKIGDAAVDAQLRFVFFLPRAEP